MCISSVYVYVYVYVYVITNTNKSAVMAPNTSYK